MVKFRKSKKRKACTNINTDEVNLRGVSTKLILYSYKGKKLWSEWRTDNALNIFIEIYAMQIFKNFVDVGKTKHCDCDHCHLE